MYKSSFSPSYCSVLFCLFFQILWHILGPNSKAILTSGNGDFSEPLNGSFHYNDGEGGVRIINLTILPHGEIEVQEKFIVVLSVASGTTEIDPKAGNVTLTVRMYIIIIIIIHTIKKSDNYKRLIQWIKLSLNP